MLPERYDPRFVALSCALALLGSYAALGLSARLTDPGGYLRPRWLLGGAAAQATGIWGMHFTGMLALILPIHVEYDVGLVILSWVIAFCGAILAFLLARRPTLSRWMRGAGGIAIGAGICGLHYTDMAAMRMPAETVYDPLWVVLSTVIAVSFGVLSLELGRRYQRDDPRRSQWVQWIAALVMGLAISGQHYSGMAAADFIATGDSMGGTGIGALSASDLPEAVVLSTLAILVLTVSVVASDQRKHMRHGVGLRLLAAQEEERRRISRTLHDDIGQLLTALRLNLERLAPGDNRVAGESISLLDQALGRVRTLSVELRPAVLDDLGLAAALTWFANRQAERAGYAVVVEEQVTSPRLPEAIETAAFRIAQEALINIARHARAKHVRIIVRVLPRTLELLVRDDGVGFDVSAARVDAEAGDSLGLLSMNEQAVLAGGALSMMSAPGNGTTVAVRFPLPM